MTDEPTSRPRRTRALALGVTLVLAVTVAAAVVVGLDEPDASTTEQPQQSAPLFTTGSTFIELDPDILTPEPTTPPRSTTAVEPGSPRRLVIPSLGVDSDIVAISAPGGVLTPPDDAQKVGWWSAGAEPGAEQGSALVTGHTLSRGGAALQDLETLERGDRIAVRTVNGRIGYRVREVKVFSKGTVAEEAAELFSQSAPGRLVVVTCEDYNGSVYLSNVVVTATPIGAGTAAS